VTKAPLLSCARFLTFGASAGRVPVPVRVVRWVGGGLAGVFQV